MDNLERLFANEGRSIGNILTIHEFMDHVLWHRDNPSVLWDIWLDFWENGHESQFWQDPDNLQRKYEHADHDEPNTPNPDCNNPKIHTPKITTTKFFLQNPMWWWVTFVGANPKCCISHKHNMSYRCMFKIPNTYILACILILNKWVAFYWSFVVQIKEKGKQNRERINERERKE